MEKKDTPVSKRTYELTLAEFAEKLDIPEEDRAKIIDVRLSYRYVSVFSAETPDNMRQVVISIGE